MSNRLAALGLFLLATLAWSLPPALRWSTRVRRPEPPVVYRESDSRQLSWSPRHRSAAAGPCAGEEPGGWEGLLLGFPLDLNRAADQDLEALPGVGPKTAAALREVRDARGGFGTVEDLLQVPGIGPTRLEALRPLVRVGGKSRE
ncbi:MAG: ComEA family DNA-binding protein [Proteobacteria bacterium]|nr:ComEA family DNA-binding protein [Pseudomonadota bacterium]